MLVSGIYIRLINVSALRIDKKIALGCKQRVLKAVLGAMWKTIHVAVILPACQILVLWKDKQPELDSPKFPPDNTEL